MAEKLTIRYWDDPVLSTVCNAVEDNEFGPKLEEFGESLLATMDAHNGIGLAGPQVGVAKRMFVMVFSDPEKNPPLVVCNPKLVLTGATVCGIEGCLSLPTVFEQVGRSRLTTMRFFRPDGVEDEIELSDLDARVAQHEFDHTRGIMFINRLTRQMRRKALRDWEKVKHNYR